MTLFFLPDCLKNKLENRPDLVKILHNVSWLVFDRLFGMGFGLAVGIMVARYLGPSQLGIMSFGLAFVSLFSPISILGLENIVVRDLVKNPQDFNIIVGTSFVLQIFGSVLVTIVAFVAIQFIKPNDQIAGLVVRIIAFGTLLQPFRTFDYINQAKVLSKYTVWADSIAKVIASSLKIYLIFTKATFVVFVWIIVIEKILTSICLVIFFIFQYKRFPVFIVSFERARLLIKDSWPLVLSGIMIMLYMRIDQVMLGKMIGDASVGVYSVAIRLTEIWYFIPLAICSSVFPSIITTKQLDETLYLNSLQKLYILLTWMALSVALIMTFASDWIINLLFGAEYIESAGILSISIWAGIFVFQGIARDKWIIAENKQRYHLIFTSIGSFINIGLNLSLIPSYGSIGAAWATLISQFSVAILIPLFFRETRLSVFMLLNSFLLKKVS